MSDPFEELVGSLDAAGPRDLVLVVTPVASAPALAGLLAMAGVECKVLPSASGAVAASYITVSAEDAVAALTGALPREACELAGEISRLTRLECVALVCTFARETGIAMEGAIKARKFDDGEAGEEVSPGLLLARLDSRIEDLATGERSLEEFSEVEDSASIPRWKALKMFTRGLRRGRSA